MTGQMNHGPSELAAQLTGLEERVGMAFRANEKSTAAEFQMRDDKVGARGGYDYMWSGSCERANARNPGF